MKKNKIDFFIVGAPKCGTTSLYNYLKQNTSIFLPDVKELHFFSQPEVEQTYYKLKIPSNIQSYLGYYKDAKNGQKKETLVLLISIILKVLKGYMSITPRLR